MRDNKIQNFVFFFFSFSYYLTTLSFVKFKKIKNFQFKIDSRTASTSLFQV